jgi:hypothetical protein
MGILLKRRASKRQTPFPFSILRTLLSLMITAQGDARNELKVVLAGSTICFVTLE